MHPLDEATLLSASDPAGLRGRTSDAYWNFGGPFGGVTAATLLRSVLDHGERQGDPCSATVNFTAAVARGSFEVDVRAVRTGRSVQHWYAELRQGDVVAANATIICARRNTTWSHQAARPPAAPDPGGITPMATDGRNEFVRQFEFRFVEGALELQPSFDGEPRSARSCLWLNNAVPRSWDFVGLMTFCDLFFGRIYHVKRTLFPIATVSMTAYFHVDGEGLAALGTCPLLGVADANVFHAGIFDQSAQLWSPDGRLLATTTQLVTWRD
ncbi:MAG: acyl-CoA thioesterase [Reyranella sp.]|uniref:acyl-CoA thioesterase n=1 Tax=Reyranella sp. TaxID=1929291 RepID=UPI003D0FDA23